MSSAKPAGATLSKKNKSARPVETTSAPGAQEPPYWTLVALVFLSGAAALIYELLWFRQLGLVFGNTVHAAATVLTAFMVGLAAGAYAAKKWVHRLHNPILAFGLLEAGIGLYALIVPAAFSAVSAAYKGTAVNVADAGAWLTGLRFVLALAVMFVPTALMGASLPVLSEAALRSRRRFATRLGLLYGSNTAGATLGVLICGFFLVPVLGVKSSNFLAAGINILIGVVTVWLARSPGAAAGAPANETSPTQAPRPIFLLTLAGLGGFLALAFETVWFRALVLVFGSTSHSFAIMVGCFLLGLVIGSALLGRLAEQTGRAGWVLAMSLGGTGLWAFLSLLAYQIAPDLFLRSLVLFDFTYTGMIVTKAVTASVFLLPLAVFSGLAFTAVVRLIRDQTRSSGQAVGAGFSINALGSAAGAAVGGFVLLPALGLERSLQALGAAAALTGLLTFWKTVQVSSRQRMAVLVGTLTLTGSLVILSPAWDPLLLCSGPYFTPRTHVQGKQVRLRENLASVQLLYYKEGTTATVSVTRTLDGRIHFSSEGKVEADGSPQSMVLQRMMGHLPMLMHPNPKRVLNIGLGAGVTSGALSCYPGAQLDIAEIEPAVTNVAAIWGERNHNLIPGGRYRLFINDGRNHLLVTTNRYDVITSDPFEPVMAGAANLYTLEHFQLARACLAPNGIMAQFLPLYELSRGDVLMILRTFAQVFPRTTVFFTGTDTVLLGFTGETKVDLAIAATKFQVPGVASSLDSIGINRVERLLDMVVMELEPGGVALDPGPVNTDNHPYIEYSAQKSALEYQTDANQRVLLRYFNDLAPRHLQSLPPDLAAEVARGRDAFRNMLHASILRSHNDLEKSVDLLRKATQMAPANPIIRNELAMTLGLLAGQVSAEPAKALYQEALQVDPRDFWALFNLEVISRGQGQLDLAAEYVRRGLEAYPDSGMFLAMRGRQRGLAGDTKGACADLAAALKVFPRRADFWNIYADFLERDGQTEAALAARSKAKHLNR